MTFGTLEPPDPQTAAAADTSPVPLTCRHLVEPVPAEERIKFVVEALVEEKVVEVALVELEFKVTKLVIVEEAPLTRSCLPVVVGERVVPSASNSQALPKVSDILA